jgi:hypothetical protein
MYCGCDTCQSPIALAMTACGEFLMERTKILELMLPDGQGGVAAHH